MSEIKLKESFANFLYFFVATLVLAFIGANIPSLAKDISEIMQEHLARKDHTYLFRNNLISCVLLRN